MTKLHIIEGGVKEGEAAPIVWNRAPVDSARRALIIRDNDDAWEPIVAAYDDGRPFLIGIRTFRLPVDAPALQAWIDAAHADSLEVRDERRADAPTLQGDISQAQRLELERRRREAPRRADPLPAGSLFDEVTRDQRSLF